MTFQPCWWLPTGHLQTCVAALTRRPFIETVSEVIPLPDNDHLELRWLHPDNDNPEAPVVLLLHGLEGSVGSHYIQGMLQQIKLKGWRGVALHFRGSNGRVNALPQSYHAGKTEDLLTALALIKQRYPTAHCSVVGYSLGGNVLLKFLGENPEQAWIHNAVAVSAPVDLYATTHLIRRGINRIYERHFMKKLKYSIGRKLEHGIKMPVTLESLKRISCFYDFDEQITAPLHGFSSAKDYYARCSSQSVLGNIKTPTLIIHAEDDPIVPKEVIPQARDISKSVQLEVQKNGGHIGFIKGGYPGKLSYWLDERIPQYLQQFIPTH